MVALSSLPASLVSLLLLSTSTLGAPPPETYTESLRLTGLPDGKAHSRFSFGINGPWNEDGQRVGKNVVAQHHSLLPTTLTSLIHHFRLSSLSLSLSSGRWAPTWPLPPGTDALPPSGIRLEAWLEKLEGETGAEEKERWAGLRGALGGVFCTTIAEGGVAGGKGWGDGFAAAGEEEEHSFYRLSVPSLAAPCTESLTPLLALLPCTNHAGLGSLLNPHKLFDGEWTNLQVGFTRTEGGAEVRIEVGTVADPVRAERLKGGLGRRDFSLSSLYDRELRVGCPVASSSHVDLVIPTNSKSRFTIEPQDAREVVSVDGEELARWDTKTVNGGTSLDVQISWDNESPFPYPSPSSLTTLPISARRLLLFSGQERGRLGVELTNHQDAPADVLWSEGWPWWVRGFVHTLEGDLELANGTKVDSSGLIEDLAYVPPVARQRPTQLQARLRLPPKSTATLLIKYESSYLWYTEYPSDAHRGFELPPATLQLLPGAEEGGAVGDATGGEHGGLKIHTASTLLSLPTPDFSMPYNVIVLTSTVMALFFGNVMNKLVREWRVVKLEEEAEGGGDGKELVGEKEP